MNQMKDTLRNAVGVDYFFNSISNFSTNEIHFIKRENIDCENIDKQHRVDFDVDQFFTFETPQVTSFQSTIKNEILK